MVDVSGKAEVMREAVATGVIKLKSETIDLLRKGKVEKGDPICAARIAGTLAAKITSRLIPFFHPLPLSSVQVSVKFVGNSRVEVTSFVKTKAQTGVEMEALTATVVGLLTVWDMVKQYEKNPEGQYPSTLIEGVRVVSKVKGDGVGERKRKKT
jgi:cyclic pyranopterin phosphate synthase